MTLGQKSKSQWHNFHIFLHILDSKYLSQLYKILKIRKAAKLWTWFDCIRIFQEKDNWCHWYFSKKIVPFLQSNVHISNSFQPTIFILSIIAQLEPTDNSTKFDIDRRVRSRLNVMKIEQIVISRKRINPQRQYHSGGSVYVLWMLRIPFISG